MSTIRFFSSQVSGLSGFVNEPSSGGPRVIAPVELVVATSPDGSSPPHTVSLDLELYGPQDVTRFDASSIVRREPSPNTRNVEPNYLPHIEFFHPELPWAFSPSGQAPYRPWLCLLVVPEDPTVRLDPNPESPHPILTLTDIPSLIGWSLPDLADSLWWSHIQVLEETPVTTPEAFTSLLKTHPERVVSRILCPVRLQPNTSYMAVLVPTTAGGVAAGLAADIPLNPLEVAWDTNTTTLRLPAYDHYTFKTGEAGDFESIVSRLEPTSLAGVASERAMLVDAPHAGIPMTTLVWEAAHRGVFGPPDAISPGSLPAPIQEGLAELFSQGYALSQAVDEPVLMPPAYGSLASSLSSLPTVTTEPFWLHELNFDPRLRAAAGLGARVIQQDQEALMQSAWAQAGAIREANDMLSRMQLARQISGVTHARLNELSGAENVSLSQYLSPQLSRVRPTSTNPLTAQAAFDDEEPITAGVLDPAFRRLVRHDSDWMRHQTPTTTTPVAYRVMTGLVSLALDPDSSDARSGMIPPQYHIAGSDEDYSGNILHSEFESDMSNLLSQLGSYGGNDTKHALWAHFAMLDQEYDASYDEPYHPPGPEDSKLVDTLRGELLSRTDPEIVAPLVVSSSINLPTLSARDPLEPIVLGPKFDRPMFDALKELDLGFVLPGIDELGDNVMGLLELNYDVIEAYMVGVNHEMARELMWRGYPTDTRATFFRQFFDISGYVPAPQTPAQREALYDLTSPLHTWAGTDELGEHVRGQNASSTLILALRGELFRRYPDTLLYMVPAFWHTLPDMTQVRRPDYSNVNNTAKFAYFRATIEPDLLLFWFDIDKLDAIGQATPGSNDPGYFFVLQESMTGTRFGLDEFEGEVPPDVLASWRELTWAHLDLAETPYITSTFPSYLDPVQPAPADGTWGDASEEMATILYQKPYLVAIHADDMFIP